MEMRIVVLILLAAVVVSLFSGLYFVYKDKGTTNRAVISLTIRIVLSVLVFAILIALANAKLKVWEDPRIDVVTGMLPGANCGACGLPGCRAFAEKAVAGDLKPSQCNVL